MLPCGLEPQSSHIASPIGSTIMVCNSQATDTELMNVTDYGEMAPVQVPRTFGLTTMAIQNIDGTYPLTDDKKWASIVPPKGGFIRLGPVGAPFSIALYHQLHCVNGIRFAYVAARDGLFKHAKEREAAFQHVNHCFDVLRQSLLCKADTTLIPLGPEKQHTRRCRDWTQIRAFVDDNHRFWADTPFQLPSNRSGQGSSSLSKIAVTIHF
ncbi:hypothetical protein F5050DRAFT_1780822 [Lentinula boryana]|uniref:Uncharacterized protein n=1 Tax=Lentinula boryana TaxID=40481 RepID=A0ABQ8Q4L0_9AGAR|nr:hypothetical protein F5050DRAFT_1780822 [Lentinula boryana]